MDRVISLFDEHGETYDVREFLHLNAFPTETRTGGGSYRSVIRDGLRVLIAVARSDGHLDPGEVDVIMDYARSEGGEATQANLLDYLAKVVRADGVVDRSEAELERLITERLERS
jgi:uncharacterized membrane protein YebE (DUF533 family)